MNDLTSLAALTPRISTNVRTAVEARVRQGLSIAAAAESAGMSRNGFGKALKRPAVQDHLRQVQEAFVAETEASRAVYKARALEAALDLMQNAQSETVRARMIEFLAGDGKAPRVAIQVDARPQIGRGYEYVRPGQQVVEIVEHVGTDTPSGASFRSTDPNGNDQ